MCLIKSGTYGLYFYCLTIIYQVSNNYEFVRTPFFSWCTANEINTLYLGVFDTSFFVGFSIFKTHEYYQIPLLLMYAVFSDVARVLQLDLIMYISFVCIVGYEIWTYKKTVVNISSRLFFIIMPFLKTYLGSMGLTISPKR